MKLLPVDLKENKLNFYDLQQMMCGYSVLGQVGFLSRDDSGRLAENLFFNVFRVRIIACMVKISFLVFVLREVIIRILFR